MRLINPASLIWLSTKTAIKKTCSWKLNPLIPHFYIAKLGFTRVYLFFLFFNQNIYYEFLLEPPRRGASVVLTCTHNACFEQKYKKKYQNFSNEIFNVCFWKNYLYITWACFRNDCKAMLKVLPLVVTACMTRFNSWFSSVMCSRWNAKK